MPSFDPPISAAEAAAILGISRRAVTRAIEVGHLPARKLPGRTGSYLLQIEDVRRFKEIREAQKKSA